MTLGDTRTDARLVVRCSSEQLAAWRALATGQGLTLSQLVRGLLNTRRVHVGADVRSTEEDRHE